MTADLDIVHSRSDDNVEKLLQLLSELDAKVRTDNRGLRPQVSHLQGRGHLLLMTTLGPLDVLCEVGADEGYEELIDETDEMSLGDGYRCRVVSLEKLIALKESAGRAKDKMALPVLRATLAEKQRSGE